MPPAHDSASISDVQRAITAWFADTSRDLPWRSRETTPWGVLVSEVMLQQTPAARVVGPWTAWMSRWPAAGDVAAASAADVLRQWDRLGYPRRALRLQQTARVVVAEHAGVVPDEEAALLALPGIGSYTAAAVMAFAYRRRSLVLDVNIRRVLARIDGGVAHPSRHETAKERTRAWHWVPASDGEAADWSAAAMELGATICTARSPLCHSCPVARQCRWVLNGRPSWEGPERVGQSWDGTNRQCRGRIMAALRAAPSGVTLTDIVWGDGAQLARCADSLVADGLAELTDTGLVLPTAS